VPARVLRFRVTVMDMAARAAEWDSRHFDKKEGEGDK
jgi:hypothetical protein